MKLDSQTKELFGAGLIFGIAAVIVGGFNYLYHVLMGRLLGPAEYGVVGSLLALIYLVSVGASTFSIVISRQVSHITKPQLRALITKVVFRNALIGLIPLLIIIGFSKYIATFLQIESAIPVIIVFIIGYIALVSPIFDGALNGLQRFKRQNISSIIGTILKLALGVLFVVLGFQSAGAIGGIVIASIIGLFVSGLFLRDIFTQKEIPFSSKATYKSFVPVLLASVGVIMLITVDIILVKHLFDPVTAGLYIALSNLGKIIVFGSGFFASPLLPKISVLHAQKKKTGQILTRGLLLTAILAACGTIAYYIAPRFIVTLLYGAEYIAIAPHLWMVGIIFSLFSLNSIFHIYNLALHRKSQILLFLFWIIVLIIGIILYHASILEVLKIMILVQIGLFISFLLRHRRDLFDL